MRSSRWLTQGASSLAVLAFVIGCQPPRRRRPRRPTAPPAQRRQPRLRLAVASAAHRQQLRPAKPGVAGRLPAASRPLRPRPRPSQPPHQLPAPTSLKGICPDNVVFQTNWWPEPDHGLFYQLIGPNGRIDTNKNSYSGPLGTTGVNAEVRAGGPAIGFQSVTAQMYSDDSILLGFGATDEQIGNSASQPTKAVMAWYAKNPQIFFWGDPSWNSRTGGNRRGERAALAFESATLTFLPAGPLKKEQIDTSYTAIRRASSPPTARSSRGICHQRAVHL
jgi:hypothetical protein